MYFLTNLQDQTSVVLHVDPKVVTHEEAVRALDQFWDWQLVTCYHNQLRTQTQDSGEALQEFATTIKLWTHHAFPTPNEGHVHRGPRKTRRHLMRPPGRPYS